MPTTPRSILAVAVVFLAAVVCSTAVHAQGTSGAFPDPISSREFERALKQLGLDDASRQTIEPMHEGYRRTMRELREGAIEEYLRQHPTGMGGFGPQRPRAEIEQTVKRREQILDQIAKSERDLFDHVQGTLAPEQVPAMQRVRSAAARERARGMFGPFGAGGLNVEVGALVDELELDAPERQAIAATVDEHERKLTRLLGELAELNVKQPLTMADAVAAAGLKRPDSFDVPPGSSPEQVAEGTARAESWFRQIGKVRSEAMAPQRSKREAIARLNRATVTSLCGALPSESSAKLFDRFVQRAYGQIGTASPAKASLEQAAKAAAAEPADPATVAVIAALAADHRARDMRIVAEMMDEIDASRQGFEMFVVDDEGTGSFEKHHRRMEELRAKRSELAESIVEQARGALGPERSERLAEGLVKKGARHQVAEGGGVTSTFTFEAVDSDGMEIVVDDGAVMVAVAGGPVDEGDFGGDIVAVVGGGAEHGGGPAGGPGLGAVGPLPTPIAPTEMRRLSEKLGVPDDQRAVIDVLHEDYAATFEDTRDQERAELGGGGGPMGMGAMPRDANGRPRTLTDGEIEQRYSAFRRGVERLSQVDAGLFENLGVVLAGTPADSRIAAAKSARERGVLLKAARGPGGGLPVFVMGGDGGKAAELDLAVILDGCGIGPDALAAANPALLRWAEQATNVARQRFETSLSAKQEIDKFHARAMKVHDDGRTDVQIDSNATDFATMQKAQERIEAANRQVADFNRAARDEIMNALPPDAREPFRRAFNRAAHPALYRDAQSARPKLESAAKVADLTDAQALQIAALAAEHEAAFEKICDQMVAAELATAPPSPGVFDGDAMRAMQTRQNDLKKLRFERTELNASTLKKLGAILTPEQVERIGGVALPEAKQRGGIQFGM